MRKILETLPGLIESGQRIAYCTVVEAKGSTPQKPGSKLVVLPDLQNIGTLGGGCVEAEARREAIGLMQTGERKLLQFRLDDDYGWDDGLICGGQMSIFVDVPQAREEAALFRQADQLLCAGTSILLATVVESGESSAAIVGQKCIVTEDGITFGTLGSVELEGLIQESASETLRGTETKLLASPIGSVFIEPLYPEPMLIIAGAGHIGQALCRLGAWIGFRVIVIDDRADFASKERLPDASEIIIGDIADTLRAFSLNESSYVTIVTRGHRHDEEALHSVVNSKARYVGMIGSRRKVKLIFDDLVERGIDPESLKRVRSPIGLDIRSQTVPEIAVSIAAELILVRNSSQDSHPSQIPQPMPRLNT